MSKIVVVTGASGHVGANLVRTLLEQGRQVRAIVRKDTRALQGLNLETVNADICDIDSLHAAFKGADVVYHLAAKISLSMSEWPLVEKINVIGTRNVVEACLGNKVRRMVHFCSIHAMVQEPFHIPVDESRQRVESPKFPPYDRSKAAGEKEVLGGIKRGLNAVIVYPTAVVGPNDYKVSHFSQALILMARGRMPALVDGGFDWVDARDVVSAAIRAEETETTGKGYLLSGRWASMLELADMVQEITGIARPRLVCPLWLAQAGLPFADAVARMTGTRPIYTRASLKAIHSNRSISHTRASKDLKYEPRPLKDTIRDTLKWFTEHGYLGSLAKTQV
jgi:dihydroflavonol-4-reductase